MIARNSFVIMLTQATSAILGVFGLFAISKMWGQHAPGIMGIVWFGFSFVGTFSFITNMGFDTAHVKRISEGRDLGKCNGTYVAIKLVLLGLFVAAVLSTILVWKHVMGGGFYDSARESIIYIFIGYYVLFSLAQIPIMTFNGLKRNAKSQVSFIMDPLFRVLLFLMVALAGVTGAVVATEAGIEIVNIPALYSWPSFLQSFQAFLASHVVGAMSFAYVFGALIMVIAGFVMLRKYPFTRPDREYFLLYLKFAVPLMIPVVIGVLGGYMDKVIIGYYWTSVEVGYYFAVQRISNFVALIPIAIGTVLFPTISYLYSRKGASVKVRNRKIAVLTKMSVRYISMLTLPLIITTILLSVPMIDIVLNSSFRPGSPALQILALNTFVATIQIPYTFLLLGTNRPAMYAKVLILFGITNVILNILFIPRTGLLSPMGIYGPTGAAIATLISVMVKFAGVYYHSRKVVKRSLINRKILLHIFAGILAGLLMWKFGSLFDAIHWYNLALFGLVGMGAYLGVLFSLGEFRKPELNFLLDTVNPLALFKYVKEELGGKDSDNR